MSLTCRQPKLKTMAWGGVAIGVMNAQPAVGATGMDSMATCTSNKSLPGYLVPRLVREQAGALAKTIVA